MLTKKQIEAIEIGGRDDEWEMSGDLSMDDARSLLRLALLGLERGDAYRAERMHVEFLGRSRHEGVRSAMRSLANYVEDNASTPKALPGAARAAFRAMLGGRS